MKTKTFAQLERMALRAKGMTIPLAGSDLEFEIIEKPIIYFFDGSEITRRQAETLYNEELNKSR